MEIIIGILALGVAGSVVAIACLKLLDAVTAADEETNIEALDRDDGEGQDHPL